MEQTPALHRKVRLFNQMIGLQWTEIITNSTLALA